MYCKMSNMKNLIMFLLPLFLCITSCGDDTDCTEATVNQETAEFNNRLNELTSTYNADQTDDNCKNLKEESEKFVEFLESLRSCTEIEQSSIENAITQAKSNLSNIPC